MRKKNAPKRGSRAPRQADDAAGADGSGGEDSGDAAALIQRPSKRARRVGEAAPVESVRCCTPEPQVLAFAELLFCVPEPGDAEAGERAGGFGGDDGAGPSGSATAAPLTAMLSAAPGHPGRLLLSWDVAAGGPEVPLAITAPSEAAASALLQLLSSGHAALSLAPVPWPAEGAAEQAPAVVYSSHRLSEGVLEGACDGVAAPRARDAVRGPHGTPRAQSPDSREGGREGSGSVAGADGNGGDGDSGDSSGLPCGLTDPGAPLLPSRVVSFLVGLLSPQLLEPPAASGPGTTQTTAGAAAAVPAPEGMQLWRARVGLGPRALEQAAGGATNPVRRPWQVALLTVAAWLAPHWGIGGASSAADESGDDDIEGAAADSRAAAQGAARPAAAAAGGSEGPASCRASGGLASPRAARGDSGPQEFDAGALYAWAKPSGLARRVAESDVPAELLPTLRPYQARAVWWMLQRERAPRNPAGLVAAARGAGDGASGSDDEGVAEGACAARVPLHPLWRCVVALPGGSAPRFYLNPFSGLISGERFEAPPPVRGGIAADEMGLGKTVELTALLLINRFKAPGATAAGGSSEQQQPKREEEGLVGGARLAEAEGPGIKIEGEEEEEARRQPKPRRSAPAAAAGLCVECGGPVDPRASAPRLTREHLEKQKTLRRQPKQPKQRGPGAAAKAAGPAKRARGSRQEAAARSPSPPPRASPAAPAPQRVSQRMLQRRAAEAAAPAKRGRGEAGTKRAAGKRRRGGDSSGDEEWRDGASSSSGDEGDWGGSDSEGEWAAPRRGGCVGGGKRGGTGGAVGSRSRRAASRGGDDTATTAHGDDGDGPTASWRRGRGGSAAAPERGASRGPSLCGGCLRKAALNTVEEPCGATLVIVPPSILPQWWSELHRHVRPGSVRISVYAGQPQPGTTSAAAMCAPTPAAGPGAFAASLVAAGGSSGAGLVATNAAAGSAGGAPPAGGAAVAPAPVEGVVTAAELASCDVVLTTYDVLRRELAMQPDADEPQRSLRRPKRYEVVPTPLTRLKWWRLVLDEAQMVGSSTAKAAEMAAKLSAQHRWAVTGTPISRGLEDLYGLLFFLGAGPWDDRRWWAAALQGPAERGDPLGAARLEALLRPSSGGLMWRSAKNDPGVAVDMALPPLLQHTTRLKLSAVERHWYNRQHTECAANARRALPERALAIGGPPAAASAAAAAAAAAAERLAAPAAGAPAVAAAAAAAARGTGGGDGGVIVVFDGAAAGGPDPVLDRPLTHAEQKKLLLPLLRLRQACCHPQVGAGGLRGGSGGGPGGAPSAPLSMGEILGVLTGKARTEAEEAQRALIHSLNGLAGLMLIENKEKEAVEMYRAALAVSEENKAEVRTDPLQRLHTLHNLAETLDSLARKQATRSGASSAAVAVPRTLRDASLRSEADTLKNAYLAARIADLEAQRSAYAKARDTATGASTRRKGGAAAAVRRRGGRRGEDGAGGGGSGAAGPSARGVTAFSQALLPGPGEGASGDGVAALLADAAAAGGGGGGNSGGGDEDGDQTGDEITPPPFDDGWFVTAIDALEASGRGEEVADVVKQALTGAETYARAGARNATSMARRFSTLGGLKLLLASELEAIAKAGSAVTSRLEELDSSCSNPSQDFVEQAATCGRCRAELGVARGRPCAHCQLDEKVLGWELRLFTLQTRALALGAAVSAEAAARAAQAQTLRRIGQGGLHEMEGEGGGAGGSGGDGGGGAGPLAGAGVRRGDVEVAETQVFHHPSEAERVLRLLLSQVQRHLSRQHPALIAVAQDHLERLEATRRMFLAARALMLAQRMLLYAHDELGMATLRMRLRVPGETVAPHEAVYKLYEEEVVARNHELSGDRLLAEEELKRKTGTLRYLKQLRLARERAEARAAAADAPETAAAAAAAAAGAAGAEPAAPAEPCPVCHDPISASCAVLPCGHQLCCGCADALVARLPPGLPWPQRRVGCPTCRARAHVADVAYVDDGGGGAGGRSNAVTTTTVAADAVAAAGGAGAMAPAADGGATTAAAAAAAVEGPPGGWWADEAGIRVKGSYGSKVEAVVRRVLRLLRDPSSRVLVFTQWSDLADILAHALRANGVEPAQARGRQGLVRAVEEFKAAAAEEARGGGGGGGGDGSGGVAAAAEVGTSKVAAGGNAGGQQQQEAGAADQQQQGKEPPAAAAGAAEAASGPAGRLAAQQLAPPTQPQPLRVLLLLVSQGGLGLTLTEAQHVVLVEPLLDPALDVQAIGRVHRFGQQATAHVHRFVVEHTVEENVAALAAQRAAAMDMAAAVPVRGAGGGGGGAAEAALTVRNVRQLLSTNWSAGGGL